MQHTTFHDDAVTYRTRLSGGWFSPGRILVLLTGVVLTVMGISAISRAGVDGDLTLPLVDVASVTHSAGVGIVEVVAGLFLLVAGASEYSRGAAGGIGLVALIAGVIGMASSSEIQRQFGFDLSTARFFVAWGAVALVGGLLPALFSQHREVESVTPDGDHRIVEQERSDYVA